MTDLEQRLTGALVEGADGAPSALGLAAAARSRARVRRRNRVVGAAAVVALAVGVPTAVLASRGSTSDGPSRVANDPSADSRVVPDGYRVESWRSVTIQVPDTWGYGGLESWCAGGGSLDSPRVSRPGGVNEAIACSPATGYGIAFQAIDNTDDFQWPVVQQDPDAGWPPGAYVGARGIGGVLVTVVAKTEAAGLDVLATMHAIGPEGDANGCSSQRGVAPPGDVPQGAMTVCRYDAGGLLEQSEVLSHDDTGRAVAALEAASTIPDNLGCPHDATGAAPIVRLRTADFHATVDLGGDCPTVHGLGPDRELTSDVLYWALSPGWSGSFPDGVPVPKELRQH
ncbi:MAG: hypothetical protein QOD98_168 [Nocardioidaceae bacterium]|nr:hypothetical protein [Nocardioidaceae bacterium]